MTDNAFVKIGTALLKRQVKKVAGEETLGVGDDDSPRATVRRSITRWSPTEEEAERLGDEG